MYYLQQYITRKEPEYDDAPMILKDDAPLCRQFFIDELKAGLSLLAIDGELSFEDSILFDSLVMDRLFYYFRIYCISKVSDAADIGMDMIKVISSFELEDKQYLDHFIHKVKDMCGLEYSAEESESDSELRDNKDQQFYFYESLIDKSDNSIFSSEEKIPANKEYFIDSLEYAIESCGHANFMTHDNISVFVDYFYPLADKLELLAKADPLYARDIAKGLKDRLMEVDTNDDVFPKYELEILDIIIQRCSEEAGD